MQLFPTSKMFWGSCSILKPRRALVHRRSPVNICCINGSIAPVSLTGVMRVMFVHMPWQCGLGTLCSVEGIACRGDFTFRRFLDHQRVNRTRTWENFRLVQRRARKGRALKSCREREPDSSEHQEPQKHQRARGLVLEDTCIAAWLLHLRCDYFAPMVS